MSNLNIPKVLGCTSPELDACDALVFLADGRFHLESAMIQNPHVKEFYKYDPYNKKLTRERYAHDSMHALRKEAIQRAVGARKFGLILGSLGRQGSPHIMQQLEQSFIERKIPYTVVLLSEIFPDKLARFRLFKLSLDHIVYSTLCSNQVTKLSLSFNCVDF